MTRPVPLIAAILGVIFLVIAFVYWLVPAGSLPAFFPGFEPDAAQVHVKHGIVALVVAIILFAVAWLQRDRD